MPSEQMLSFSSAIGRGNEIVSRTFMIRKTWSDPDFRVQVCYAINQVATRIVGMDVESIFADMGAFWNFRKRTLPDLCDSR